MRHNPEQNFAKALWITILVLLLVPAVIQAKRYDITAVAIKAELQDNGDMEVSESRTYKFKGRYRYAYQVIPLHDRVKWGDIQILEGGKAYQPANSEKPGTYKITTSDDEIEIRWYFSARNEERTFELRYTAGKVIERFADASVLYYKFIGSDWRKKQSDVSLEVVTANPLSGDSVKAWLHGPLWANLEIQPEGRLVANCEVLPSRTFLEIRALYPQSFFGNVLQQSGNVSERIFDEEAGWAQEANDRRARLKAQQAALEARIGWGKYLVSAISGLFLIGLTIIANRFSNRPSLPQRVDMISEIPDDTPPALLYYLMHNRTIGGPALAGTLFDLARRGVLAVTETATERSGFFGGSKTVVDYRWELQRSKLLPNTTTLKEYERQLITYLFDELSADGISISVKDIQKQQSKFIKFFSRWRKTVKAEAGKADWYDAESRRGMYWGLLLSAILTLIGLISIWLFRQWALIPLITAVAIMITSLIIPHRTEKGELIYQKWTALKKYLKQQRYALDQTNWQKNLPGFLVYGVILGISGKSLKNLTAVAEESDLNLLFPWYIVAHNGHGDISGIADGFSSMVAATSSALSTASGTGGGASGGGGGGAGGGGGGAG